MPQGASRTLKDYVSLGAAVFAIKGIQTFTIPTWHDTPSPNLKTSPEHHSRKTSRPDSVTPKPEQWPGCVHPGMGASGLGVKSLGVRFRDVLGTPKW